MPRSLKGKLSNNKKEQKCIKCNIDKSLSCYRIEEDSKKHSKICNKCQRIVDKEFKLAIKEANILQYQDVERICSQCNIIKQPELFGDRRSNGKTQDSCLKCRGFEDSKVVKVKKIGWRCKTCKVVKEDIEFGGLKKNGKIRPNCIICKYRYKPCSVDEIQNNYMMMLNNNKLPEEELSCLLCTASQRCIYCEERRIRCPCGNLKYKCPKCKEELFCPHYKYKTHLCKYCTPNYYCLHKVAKHKCKYCSLIHFLITITSKRVEYLFGNVQERFSLSYLGCSAEEYKTYLEGHFTEDMDWVNYGEIWKIYEIKSETPFSADSQKNNCLKYFNTIPICLDNRKIRRHKCIG